MRIVAKSTLVGFWTAHNQAEAPLRVWYDVVRKAEWTGPDAIKAMFGANVDFVGDNRVIFDIAGNKYQFVVHVSYTYRSVLIKFIGTHAQYDRINAETVDDA